MEANAEQPPRVRNNNPRTTSAGFDPEGLERGAKTLQGINNSSHAKKVFERIKKQEETIQKEFSAKSAEFKSMQAQAESASLIFAVYAGGLRAILTDQNKLVVAVGGVTALAGGIYTTRKGAKVIWSYVDKILGQPSLVRESTIGKYPWSGFSRGISTHSRGADKGSALKNGDGFGFGKHVQSRSEMHAVKTSVQPP